VDLTGEGLYWAEVTSVGSVVHGAAALPVLLVVNIETDAIRLAELGQRGGMWENGAIPKEADVLTSELDRSRPGLCRWHCVFTWSEKKEKGSSE
jgi:hypothetical protein